LERRLRRTCYYADGRPLDRLSLPLTEAVVEYFSKNAPFDDLDLQYASEVSYAGAVSPSVLIVAMIYLERMRLTKRDHFESKDPADLFISALLCATKFLYDEAENEFVYNDEWAESCGRRLSDMNRLEVELLNALEWDTMAQEEEFQLMLRSFEIAIAKRQCEWRGFASYSDISVLITNMTEIWTEILLPAFVVIGLATLTYTASVVGLYACSLYPMTTAQNISRSALPVSPLSMPSVPLDKPTLMIDPIGSANRVQPAWNMEHEMKKQVQESPTVEKSSSLSLSQLLKRNNASLCGTHLMRSEDVELPSPWTTWFYPAKTFSIWSI